MAIITKTCSMEGCIKAVKGRGLCAMHYMRLRTNGNPLITLNRHEPHGMSGSQEYSIWAHMLNRCRNPRAYAYAEYGGRGIKVCDEWANSFGAFIRDMGSRPSPDHTLERMNVNGDYEPANCCWSLGITQAANQRVKITNKSGYRGVSWSSYHRNWRAQMDFDHSHLHIGYFDSAEEAAWMYDQYVIALREPWCPTNFDYLPVERQEDEPGSLDRPKLMVANIEEMGMSLKLYKWKSCIARVGEGDDWATVYFIESSEPNNGHATELMKLLKHVYRNRSFGGTVALNPAMKRVYEKSGVREYDE